MIDKQFEKRNFQKKCKRKRKIPLSKNTGRSYTGADLPGCNYTVKDVIIDNWLEPEGV